MVKIYFIFISLIIFLFSGRSFVIGLSPQTLIPALSIEYKARETKIAYLKNIVFEGLQRNQRIYSEKGLQEFKRELLLGLPKNFIRFNILFKKVDERNRSIYLVLPDDKLIIYFSQYNQPGYDKFNCYGKEGFYKAVELGDDFEEFKAGVGVYFEINSTDSKEELDDFPYGIKIRDYLPKTFFEALKANSIYDITPETIITPEIFMDILRVLSHKDGKEWSSINYYNVSLHQGLMLFRQYVEITKRLDEAELKGQIDYKKLDSFDELLTSVRADYFLADEKKNTAIKQIIKFELIKIINNHFSQFFELPKMFESEIYKFLSDTNLFGIVFKTFDVDRVFIGPLISYISTFPADYGVIPLADKNYARILCKQNPGRSEQEMLMNIVCFFYDMYCLSKGIYSKPHHPIPFGFGFKNKFYYRQYVDGIDSFTYKEDGEPEEWKAFEEVFSNVGIVYRDLADPHDPNVSKNIVVNHKRAPGHVRKNRYWYAIDHENNNVKFEDPNKFLKFVKENELELKHLFGDNYDFFEIARLGALNDENFDRLKFYELLGKFQELILGNTFRQEGIFLSRISTEQFYQNLGEQDAIKIKEKLKDIEALSIDKAFLESQASVIAKAEGIATILMEAINRYDIKYSPSKIESFKREINRQLQKTFPKFTLIMVKPDQWSNTNFYLLFPEHKILIRLSEQERFDMRHIQNEIKSVKLAKHSNKGKVETYGKIYYRKIYTVDTELGPKELEERFTQELLDIYHKAHKTHNIIHFIPQEAKKTSPSSFRKTLSCLYSPDVINKLRKKEPHGDLLRQGSSPDLTGLVRQLSYMSLEQEGTARKLDFTTLDETVTHINLFEEISKKIDQMADEKLINYKVLKGFEEFLSQLKEQYFPYYHVDDTIIINLALKHIIFWKLNPGFPQKFSISEELLGILEAFLLNANIYEYVFDMIDFDRYFKEVMGYESSYSSSLGVAPLNKELGIELFCKENGSITETEMLRNIDCYFLDKYFVQKGKYTRQHIPKPIGFSIGSKRLYREHVKGVDSFIDFPLEFSELSSAFSLAGIIFKDFQECWGPTGKNIVINSKDELGWHLIDYESIVKIEDAKINKFISENEKDLREVLGRHYNFFEMAVKDLTGAAKIKESLEFFRLFGEFQKDILTSKDLKTILRADYPQISQEKLDTIKGSSIVLRGA